jgi:hypothetical protein
MRIWGKEIIRDLICWILMSVRSIKFWQPYEGLRKFVDIPLSMANAPALKLNGRRLARGPTRLTRRSDL